MSRTKSPSRFWAILGALTFVAGILVGWLVIGWQLWPVQWMAALPNDLGPTERERYLDLVSESYVLNKDVKLVQERLATFPVEQQAALLNDVKTRVARRLQQTQNILVLGADQRPGWEAWRTDSIMVVAIDQKNEQIGILSIPRDLYVDVPGYGKERINAADYIGEKQKYPGGGPALAARVVSETLGIPTQHWVRIQMDGLARLVDALGGVDVTLDCPLYERAPDGSAKGYTEWTLPAGQVHLDGNTARKFATYRYITTDFGRTLRQQQLIWAIRNRALQGNVIPRIPELWRAMSSLFETDLGISDVIGLANLGIKLRPTNVHGMIFSRATLKDYTTEDGQMVLLVSDREALEAEIEQLFFRKPLEQLGRNAPGKENQCPPPPKP